MEISLRPSPPIPQIMPDVRPAADAAATTRDPRPEVPLPIPPGTAASGIAASAALATSGQVEPVAATVRTLKPYGITMLPDEAAQRAAAERARDAAAARDAAEDPAPDVAARQHPEAERPTSEDPPRAAADTAPPRPETVGNDG